MVAKKTVLWVTDPWETLDHSNDTSLRLIEESLRQGIPSFWCDLSTIRIDRQKILLTAQKVLKVDSDRSSASFQLSPPAEVAPSKFSVIHYRTDPPVDGHYLHPLQLLAEDLRGTRSRIINPPEVLFLLSEKSGAGLPKGWTPETFMGTHPKLLAEFGRRLGRTVAKPPHMAQSQGVELLEWQTPEQEARSLKILGEMTKEFTTPVVLQQFMDAVFEGEKRLWYVNGKLIATILKRPLRDDFRVLVDSGSEILQTELTASEKRRAVELGGYLRKQKIVLAAVDLIGGKISDLNFTSPGLIVQMEKITGKNLAEIIIRTMKLG